MTPEKTILGELTILEVYEYLDGPRFFAAKNNVGVIFLVYWCEEERDKTGWLYLQISEAKLSDLRRKKLTIHAAFKKPETIMYLVYTKIRPEQDSVEMVSASTVNEAFIPPDGFYIEYVDVLHEENEWVFETILNKNISAEAVSEFIARLQDILENIKKSLDLDGSDKKPLKIFPRSALAGSIKIKFDASDTSAANNSLAIINDLISCEDKEEIKTKLIKHGVDSSQLKEFLSTITRNKLDVEIAPKLSSYGKLFKLPIKKIEELITMLDGISHLSVPSIKIPQANDIDKVFDIIKLIAQGKPLIPINFHEISERQVKYYTDAAYALDLITRDNRLTTAGQFINSRSDKKEQYEILADRFASTEFGWAWMSWANVQYMTELDPNSAKNFLRNIPNISEKTAHRRASTLRKWLTELQQYHRKYQK